MNPVLSDLLLTSAVLIGGYVVICYLVEWIEEIVLRIRDRRLLREYRNEKRRRNYN